MVKLGINAVLVAVVVVSIPGPITELQLLVVVDVLYVVPVHATFAAHVCIHASFVAAVVFVEAPVHVLLEIDIKSELCALETALVLLLRTGFTVVP
jgi:hypothetical protein